MKFVETDRVKLTEEAAKSRACEKIRFDRIHGEVVQMPRFLVTMEWCKFNKGKSKNVLTGCQNFKGKTVQPLELTGFVRVKWDDIKQEFNERVEDLVKA